jgi:hypothetical protein
MGTVMPRDNAQMVTFGNMHIDPWNVNMVAIGVASADYMDFKSAASDAQAALTAAETARINSKAATDAYYSAVAKLRAKAAICVRSIQAKAKATGDTNIYALAQISPPDPRSHTGQPPAQPTTLRATLNPDGSITLTWKCSNPRGVSRVVYFVQRKLDTETEFTLVDTVGEKMFTDKNLPFGTQQAVYMITGKAGSLTGPVSEAFTVMFGTGGGGALTIVGTSTGTAPAVKMAA